MEYYRLILYGIFGVLPSLVWLFYYLRKDLHPEPKRMILQVFLWGSLITIPVFLLQIGLSELLNELKGIAIFSQYPIVVSLLQWFVVIALTEELFKYLVVKINISGSYVLDEPLDLMLYMVVVALGFAMVENILYLFSPINMPLGVLIETTATVTFIRFIGATFLHTLCSGLLGYFLALSSLKNKKGVRLTIVGLVLAVFLHGLYDFSIATLQNPFNIIIPVAIMAGLIVFMLYDFNEVKKIKGICKL